MHFRFACQRGFPGDQQQVVKSPDPAEPELFLLQGLHDVVFQYIRVADNTQMKSVVEDVVHSFPGVGLGKVDLNLLQILNFLEELRKCVGDVCRPGNRNVDGGLLIVTQPGLTFQVVQLIYDFFRSLKKVLTVLGDRGAPGASLKYGVTQCAF